MPPIKRILCPTDFSTSSRPALAQALELASRLGASVTLAHVVHTTPFGMGAVYTMPPGVIAEAEQEVQKHLAEWKKQAEQSAPGVPVETRVLHGSPAHEIVREAANGYDLVAMGTHGLTGLSHALLGSIAEKVVRTSPCAVLTVRSQT